MRESCTLIPQIYHACGSPEGSPRSAEECLRWVVIILVVIVAIIIAIFAAGAVLPRKHAAMRAIRLHQPQQAVWSVISNHAAEPSWRPDLESIKQLPDRNGHAVWQETYKNGNTLELEDIDVESPRYLVREVHDTGNIFSGRWEIQVSQQAIGSGVNITETGEVPNPIFRFVSRFVFGHTKSMDDYLRALAAKFGENASIVTVHPEY